jgi:hypothetical protein
MKIEIYMKCPVCYQEGYNSASEYWQHSWPCNGTLYLDEHAVVHCKKCRKNAPLIKWKLRCGNDKHNFSVVSAAGFASVIAQSAQYVNQAGLAWLQSAINYIGK